MDYKKAFPLVEKFVQWGTPKRVILLALTAVVLVVSITMYEQRATFAGLILQDREPPRDLKIVVHDAMKQKVAELVTKSEHLLIAAVISANLRINERELIFYSTDSTIINSIVQKYVSSKSLYKPIFTGDDKNNAQMIAVINGEFGCFRYDQAVSSGMVPKLGAQAQAVCLVSLPPYMGKFSGYIAFILSKMPDEQLQRELRLEAVKLSTEIYLKSLEVRK